MGYTPYFIGPLKVGLERDMDSYLIPEDAYPALENAYLWRGRNYKKGGTELLGRLGVRSDTLALRGAPPQVYNAGTVYFPIEPGSLVITDGITTFTDNGLGVMVVSSGSGTAGTVNYTTGAYTVTFTGVNAGASVTATYILVVNANSPVMGLREFEVPASVYPGLVAFDMRVSYRFDNPSDSFIHIKYYKQATGQTTLNTVEWTGTNSQFFYTVNYQGALFATNGVPGAHFYAITNTTNATPTVITIGPHNFQANDVVYINNLDSPGNTLNNTGRVITAVGANTITVNAAGGAYNSGGVAWSQTLSKAASGDGIRWYDGTGWVNFSPPLDGSPTPNILQGCLLLFAYKGYFVALNTIEGVDYASRKTYANRARWSNQGPVYYSPNPLPVGIVGPTTGREWYEKGTFEDAPTSDEIVAAEFIKDTLVVYFERSTYRLTATGNPIDPFIWEKINTEIGCESTFSVIPFDKGILSVAQNGIYACDSINIDRIDRIIPDEVFNFTNNTNGIRRVHGIRDFFNEMTYWTFVDGDLNADAIVTTFPNRTLIYNYLTTSYSIFRNSYTVFGQYQFINDLTWATATKPWQSYNRAWNAAGNRVNFPVVIGGNQQGYVEYLEDSTGEFFNTNDVSLSIQNISAVAPSSVFTSINHNLDIGDHIIITGANGTVGINGNTLEVATVPTNDTFTLIDIVGNDISTLTWTFGGQITIVDNFDITTKNLNPYYSQGKSMRLGYVDFYLDNITANIDPQIKVQLFLDDDSDTFIEEYDIDLTDKNSLGVINEDNDKFWTRVYFQSQGQFLSLKLLYDEIQIFFQANTSSQVVIHGMILWMKPTGRMLNV